MRTIWKFPVPIADRFTIPMPEAARVLCVQVQRETPYVWTLCDETAPMEDRVFLLSGTGHPRDDLAGARYVGSFQLHDGALIFHLFEQETAL